MIDKAKNGFMLGLSLNKLSPYLYDITYPEIDYSNGYDFFEDFHDNIGLCSSLRSGGYFGRNYDWYYDESASFVIHCPPTDDRHGSVGVAGGLKELTDAIADSGVYHKAYKYLPFFTVDGINDAGVTISINVVPAGDSGRTTGTNENGQDMCAVMMTRYILDYANSARHAIELIRDLNIYCPTVEDLGQEVHWLICDKENSYVVELINNHVVVINEFVNDVVAITNFYINGFDGNTSTAYYKSETYDSSNTTLTPHAMGIERYDIIRKAYDNNLNKSQMRSILDSLKYTKSYDAENIPFWYSEFSADLSDVYMDLTIDSTVNDYEPLVSAMIELFENRTRNGKTWHTVHSSIYDIENKTLYLHSQERDTDYEFEVDAEEQGEDGMSKLCYDDIVGAFLLKISDYDFAQMPTERDGIVNVYMRNAVSEFKKNCLYNLTASYNDCKRVFDIDIKTEDIDELIDIISEGMVAQWLKQFVYRQENLQNILNTRDYTMYSPAELLLRIGNAHAEVKKNYTQMIREYSYNHGDLTRLHI